MFRLHFVTLSHSSSNRASSAAFFSFRGSSSMPINRQYPSYLPFHAENSRSDAPQKRRGTGVAPDGSQPTFGRLSSFCVVAAGGDCAVAGVSCRGRSVSRVSRSRASSEVRHRLQLLGQQNTGLVTVVLILPPWSLFTAATITTRCRFPRHFPDLWFTRAVHCAHANAPCHLRWASSQYS